MAGIDAVVLNSIREKDGTVDVGSDVYQLAVRVANATQSLAKPLTPIKLKSAKVYTQFGCCAEFISLYNEKLKTAPEHVCINIMGKDIDCEREVYVALVCLGLSSIHVIEARAQACATLFKLVFMDAKNGPLTSAGFYKLMSSFKAESYYEKELVKAINVCLFGENEASLCWQSLVEPMGYYDDVIKKGTDWVVENGLDKKSLITLLKSNYTRAKDDKEFMSEIYKPAVNKWLIAMMYILKDTHPAITKPANAGTDGFM